jgi:hypothetical protein
MVFTLRDRLDRTPTKMAVTSPKRQTERRCVRGTVETKGLFALTSWSSHPVA